MIDEIDFQDVEARTEVASRRAEEALSEVRALHKVVLVERVALLMTIAFSWFCVWLANA